MEICIIINSDHFLEGGVNFFLCESKDIRRAAAVVTGPPVDKFQVNEEGLGKYFRRVHDFKFYGGWREGGNLTKGEKTAMVHQTTINYVPVAFFHEKGTEIGVDRLMVRSKVGVVICEDNRIPTKVGDFAEIGEDV